MLFVVGAGYLYDVKFLLAEHAELLANTEKIRSKMRDTQHQKTHSADQFQQAETRVMSENFSQFSRLAHAFHLEILSAVSVRPQHDELVQDDDYNVILRGDYVNIYQFLANAPRMEVKNLMLTPEQQLRVRAEMSVRLSDEIAAGEPSISHVINPFCGAEKPHAAKKFSRDEMQFLGTVVRDRKRYTVVKSPDGVVTENGEG